MSAFGRKRPADDHQVHGEGDYTKTSLQSLILQLKELALLFWTKVLD